jgi:protoporphyrinogen oxidase
MLALEITCHFNDKTWKSSDNEIFEKCIDHMESDGFVNRDEVKQFFTVRIKSAYPFYRLGYKKNLTTIFEHFKQIPNLTLAGRTGAFKYMDIDQCMEDTDDLVKRFKKEGVI